MWLLPTRLRPSGLKRFFDCFETTWAKTPGVVFVDEDDPCLNEYLSIHLPEGWTMEIGPRLPVGQRLNAYFKVHPDEPWYGFLADDVMPRTLEWDRALVEEAGRYGLAFCDDTIHGNRHATHFVVGGDLVRQMGWIVLPGLDRIYGDTVWNDIARANGVFRYVKGHVVEHMHFSNQKSKMDATYVKPSSGEDERIYQEWVNSYGK